MLQENPENLDDVFVYCTSVFRYTTIIFNAMCKIPIIERDRKFINFISAKFFFI